MFPVRIPHPQTPNQENQMSLDLLARSPISANSKRQLSGLPFWVQREHNLQTIFGVTKKSQA
jgi:hypothetical protein